MLLAIVTLLGAILRALVAVTAVGTAVVVWYGSPLIVTVLVPARLLLLLMVALAYRLVRIPRLEPQVEQTKDEVDRSGTSSVESWPAPPTLNRTASSQTRKDALVKRLQDIQEAFNEALQKQDDNIQQLIDEVCNGPELMEQDQTWDKGHGSSST